ncbi:MAG: dihydroorotase [Bacteroidota bacterium]
MDTVIFRNVTIQDPKGPHHQHQADVVVLNGTIASVDGPEQAQAEGAVVIEGGHLSPGWLDLRVHLTDPGCEWKEDLDSLSQAAIAGGFTRVVTLPNTDPVIDNRGLIKSLIFRAEHLPIDVLPCGALSTGAAGSELAELYDMAQAGAVAFTDGLRSVNSPGLLLRALQYLKPFDGVLFNTPLESSLAPHAEIGESPTSMRMGLKGIPAIAEEMMLERDLKLLHYFPHRLHVGPITTAGGIEILRRTKADHPQLTIETSALYLLLDDRENTAFHSYTKVYPPLREKAAVNALRAAVADGLIDAISSSHHPQSIEEKKHDFPTAEFGAETLEVAFAAAWTGLRQAAVPLERLIAALTSGPRKVLKLPVQSIVPGAPADLTHFDPEAEWAVAKSDLRSKSRNNPLIGRTLTGRPQHVVAKGRLHVCH